MRTQYFIALIIILTHISCQQTNNENQVKDEVPIHEELIVGEVDTAKIISALAIKESASRHELSNEKIEGLSDQIDTIELTYYFGFCDCQRWIVSETHKKAEEEHPDLNELDARGQIEFNLNEHGYYIEAANKDLEIDWRTTVNGTTIRFIGREYMDKRLPKNEGFTVPDPPKGKVFRYYSYQILRPYKVWGPQKFREIDEHFGDSIIEQTILTVR